MSDTIALTDALDSATQMIAEDRVTRGKWRGTRHGKETLCLYLALARGTTGDTTTNCPIEGYPQWLADATPWFDDCGTEAHWRTRVPRLIAALRLYLPHGLSERQSTRVRSGWMIDCLDMAAEHTTGQRALASIARVRALHERVLADDPPTREEWESAAAAAAAEVAAAAWVAEVAAAAAWAAAAEVAEAAEAADRVCDALIARLELEADHE